MVLRFVGISALISAAVLSRLLPCGHLLALGWGQDFGHGQLVF